MCDYVVREGAPPHAEYDFCTAGARQGHPAVPTNVIDDVSCQSRGLTLHDSVDGLVKSIFWFW